MNSKTEQLLKLFEQNTNGLTVSDIIRLGSKTLLYSPLKELLNLGIVKGKYVGCSSSGFVYKYYLAKLEVSQ